jgi:hypothetical protein
MTLKCGDSSAQILPGQDGRMPRAHVLKSEVLAKTVGYNSIPPNSSSAVFVIGPISDAAVGSDAIAEPGFGPWAGLTGQTLTTILQDKCKRKGAFVLVTNPSPSKSIIIPPGSPIAKLDINWRRVRAEAFSGGTEPEAIREEYKSGPRRFPIMTITTGEETVGATHTGTRYEPLGKLPDWIEQAIQTVKAEGKYGQEVLETVAKGIVTAMDDAVEDLGPDRARLLATTLLRHAETFSPIRFDEVLISDKLEPMTIPVKEGTREQRFPPRRLGFARRQMLGELVRNMLKDGVIQPSSSPWAFPVVIAPKADGSPRFCVDYRRLNEVTRKDSYPLPRMDDLLDRLGEAKFRSVMDLSSGYWQIPMKKEDREKTAFITPDGLFEFLVLPFGLCNAPAHFQRAMNKVLAGMNFFFTCVYLDDVIVFSRTFEEHIDHMDKVLTRLELTGLKAKLAKCSFCRKEIKYLGHIVSDEGVRVDPEKTETIRNAPPPTNKKELRSFLGLLNYYRKFNSLRATRESQHPCHDSRAPRLRGSGAPANRKLSTS